MAHDYGYQIVAIGGGKDGFTMTVRRPGESSASGGTAFSDFDELFDDGEDQTKTH